MVRDSVIRFRYSTTGKFENDFSYGVTIHASRGYSFLDVTEDETHYIITTSKLVCKVEKQSLQVRLFDAIDNKLINEDEIGFHWEESYEYGGDIVKMSKACQKGRKFLWSWRQACRCKFERETFRKLGNRLLRFW